MDRNFWVVSYFKKSVKKQLLPIPASTTRQVLEECQRIKVCHVGSCGLYGCVLWWAIICVKIGCKLTSLSQCDCLLFGRGDYIVFKGRRPMCKAWFLHVEFCNLGQSTQLCLTFLICIMEIIIIINNINRHNTCIFPGDAVFVRTKVMKIVQQLPKL